MEPLNSTTPVFFGLKWRTLIALSLVLALVNGALAFLVYRKAMAQFEAEQVGARLTQAREFDAVFSKGLESMSTFAAFIPRLAVPQGPGGVVSPDRRLAAALDEHGLMLNVEWGVEAVHYYDADRPALPSVSWPPGRRPPPVADLLEKAALDDTPQGTLVCGSRCAQLIVLPLLRQGVTDGLLVVERSIGDSLREFHLLSGAHVVVLREGAPPAGVDRAGIAEWDRTVVGVTHRDVVLPVIEAVAAGVGLGELRTRPERILFGADWFEVSALPVATDGPGTAVLLVDRVTGRVLAVREATRDSILLGVTGLVVSELILLMVLWGPMRRTRGVVESLPLLADRQYASLRETLSGIAREGPARDEIDLMVGVVRDVADQIETLDQANLAAGHALRESEQGLRFAQSMARVTAWNGRPLDGHFVFGQGARSISPVLAHVSRWSEFLALVHPEDRCQVLKAWRAGRAGGSMDVEFRLLVGDRQIDLHAVCEFDAIGPGRILTANGMMQDISETRAVSRELQAHRERLEDEVTQRTAELAAARNRAERLADSKGRFLAQMSHEIRTPLNAVLGLCQAGLQQGADARAATRFRQILDAGGHLLNVVNDVLDFSKLEAGRLVIEPRPFDLRETIRRCVDMFGQPIAARSLAMRVSIADDVPEAVMGDAFRLQQILINLLGNAMNATEQGSVSLDVYREGGVCCYSVSDTGVGIAADQLSRLFQPFHQGGMANRGREGTGLGLSISNGLAAMMGGDIRVSSEPGRGSEFVLRLPLRAASGTAAGVQAADPGSEAGQRLAGIRVLVADDVAINRQVLEALLEGEGAEVTSVEDGRAVVQALLPGKCSGFDVVLMDVEMPDLDGRCATREIRMAGLRVPIIGVTAHVSADERAASIAAGMQDQLVKPILQQDLVRAILGCTAGAVDITPGRQSMH